MTGRWMHCSKERSDATFNLPRLTLSKAFGQPWEWVSRALAVIAPVQAMTGWNDVGWRVSSPGAKRNVVILGEDMPEAGRATAIGAAVSEIIQRVLPVGGGEGDRQPPFQCSAALIGKSGRNPVKPAVPTVVITRMAIVVTALPFAGAASFTFGVTIGIFRLITSVGLLLTVRVSPVPLAQMRTVTLATPGAQSGLTRFVWRKEIRSERKFLAAARAAAGDDVHSMFTSCRLPDVVSAGGGNNRFSGATLADASLYHAGGG